ncbi:MAG: RNA-binding S4 domain-containing protein [Candidatus Melainabacteria bacterium]
MRLDKFLKVSRLVKRRTVASDLCSGGQVKINGKTAKPASEVTAGDILRLRIGSRVTEARIEEVPLKAVPAQAADRLYTVLKEETVESPL